MAHQEENPSRAADSFAAILYLRTWRLGQRVLPFAFPHPIRLAVHEQNKIGWLDLLEGRASKQWQLIQKQHYEDHNMRKSSKRWIRGLLKQLHYLAKKQWEHRNQINQQTNNPAQAQLVRTINDDISELINHQLHELFPGDKTRLNCNLFELLGKPLRHKRSWLANARTARQRYLRHLHNKADLDAHSKRTSKLFKYLKQLPKRSKTHPT